MKTSISTMPGWKYRLSDLFVFFWFLTLSLYLSQQRSFPYIFDDEYGVLGAAATFAGLDWTAPAAMSFYGFLLSLITFPVYWLDLEPTMMYRTIIAANALLVATSAVLALRTIRFLFETQSEAVKAGIVIAAFSYPAVLHMSAMAMTESTLLFCFFLITYHLVALLCVNGPRMLNAVLLGVGIGLAQYAHTRGIAFVISSTIIILYALRTHSIPRKLFMVIATSALFSMLFLGTLKAYLLTSFYVQERASSSSVLSFLDSRLALLDFHGLIALVMTGVGQFTYLATSTFGLLVSGLGILSFITWNYFIQRVTGLRPNPDQFRNNAIGLVSGFVLLSFLIMFFMSVLAIFKGQRADHVFYGRYNEVITPTILVVSLLFLINLSKKAALRWIMTGFFVAVFFLLLVNLYPDHIFQRKTFFLPITSWLVYVVTPWKIDPKNILFGLVLAFSVLTVSFVTSRRLFVGVLIAFFTSSLFHNFGIQHKGADRDWMEFNQLSLKFGDRMTGMNLQATGADWKNKLKGEALQFTFPLAHISYNDDDLTSADAVLDYGDAHCMEENIIARVGEANFCIVSERLQNQIKLSPVPPVGKRQKPIYPTIANIEFSDGDKSAGIKLGTIERVCALMSTAHYTQWFRYCLPSVEIKITQHGLSGNENHRLGLYITDLQGEWINEWKTKIDNQKLAQKGELWITLKPRVPARLPSGIYWLNVATVDEYAWDFRSNKKIQLSIE